MEDIKMKNDMNRYMTQAINKPVLVIMAAGMGSRYGGLKQIDPIDEQGHIIMDFSIYDAIKAGFQKVVFIIKKENEHDFREVIGSRISDHIKVEYVYQDISNIPNNFQIPEGRIRPWGTGHAILSTIDVIDGPFAVINADDYYGSHAFQLIYDFLSAHQDDSLYRYTMVGYQLKNTVTDNGHVARGICTCNEQGLLTSICERTRIEKHNEGIAYSEDGGTSWTSLNPDTIVSMNLWGFSKSILEELKNRFPSFLENGLRTNPMNCEYFLPSVVSDLLQEEKASATVLTSQDKWYGVTYQEDKPVVVSAIQKMKDAGKYPSNLWD